MSSGAARARAGTGSRVRPRATRVAPVPDEAGAGEIAANALMTRYIESFSACPEAERGGVLIDFIRQKCIELLRLDPTTSFFDEQPLLDLGLDSLVGLEVRNDLQKLAGITLPSTLFFDCPTLADLTRYFQLVFCASTPAAAARSHESYERISV